MAKKPKKSKSKIKMEEMNERHLEIIQEMIENGQVEDFGIKDRYGRAAHEFRIDNVPYWIIMAG